MKLLTIGLVAQALMLTSSSAIKLYIKTFDDPEKDAEAAEKKKAEVEKAKAESKDIDEKAWMWDGWPESDPHKPSKKAWSDGHMQAYHGTNVFY